MTGILEQISADIRANTAAINALASSMVPGMPMPATAGLGAAAAQTATLAAPAQTVRTDITNDMITQLIRPHITNDTIKAALGVAMRGLGINGLPETPPHLHGPLYAAFQQVLAAHGVSGAAQPATTASII